MGLPSKYSKDIAFKDLKEFHIKIIPHSEQSYETWGDYWIDDNNVMQIRVSEFKNRDYSFYVIMHELAEIWRVVKKKIKMSAITRFDLKHPELDDPGTDPKAPYHKEHMASMDIEFLLCCQDGNSWKKYNNTQPKGDK